MDMVQIISGGADGHMSMRPWVGYAVMGKRLWVMGMACVLWVAGYGRGLAWGMGRPRGW